MQVGSSNQFLKVRDRSTKTLWKTMVENIYHKEKIILTMVWLVSKLKGFVEAKGSTLGILIKDQFNWFYNSTEIYT